LIDAHFKYAFAKMEGGWYFIDKNSGEKLQDYKFDDIERLENTNYFKLKRGAKYGWYDISSNKRSAVKYQDVRVHPDKDSRYKILQVKTLTGWHKAGKPITPMTFRYIKITADNKIKEFGINAFWAAFDGLDAASNLIFNPIDVFSDAFLRSRYKPPKKITVYEE